MTTHPADGRADMPSVSGAVLIDAHLHLFDLERFRYPWLVEPALRRTFSPDDVDPPPAVLVQALDDPAETRWLLQVCAEHPERFRGVVGCAAALEYPVPKGLVGVRVPAAALTPALLRAAIEADMVVDVLTEPAALPSISALVRHHPGSRVVVDHLGGFVVARESAAQAATILARSLGESVWCKYSGLLTRGPGGTPAHPEALAVFTRTVLDQLGAPRLLFGSDWPVCLLAGSRNEASQLAEDALEFAGADDSERQAVLGGTAQVVYRLPVAGLGLGSAP